MSNDTSLPRPLKRARRQPVSCTFCRTRKLRCSRESPCSNCISRFIDCDLKDESRAVTTPTRTNADNGAQAAANGEDTSKLLDRLSHLEEVVSRQVNRSTLNIPATPRSVAEVVGQNQTPTLNHEDHSETGVTNAVESSMTRLENIYNYVSSGEDLPRGKVLFKICSIKNISNMSRYSITMNDDPTLCVWLPEFAESILLLGKYVRDVDHVHHVVHSPSLLAVFQTMYTAIRNESSVSAGNALLVLAIIGACTHHFTSDDCVGGLFEKASDANKQAVAWFRSVEDVLEIAQKHCKITLEGLQGLIISAFTAANLGGFSRSYRRYSSLLSCLACELGLHMLDHPSTKFPPSEFLRHEISRRVWWYIVAWDWSMAARFPAMSYGTYSCHPRQMYTRRPLDLNDEEIGIAEPTPGRPTMMSYSLQRLKLAEISRSIVDRAPISSGRQATYDDIIEIDTELQHFENDLPSYFSASAEDLWTQHQLDFVRARHIAYQGYSIRALLFSQRCKLHLPYFSRAFADPTYSISKSTCLRSAQQFIKNEKAVREAKLDKGLRHRNLGLLLGVFMASIVLLMDLCHGRVEAREVQQKGDIVDAFQMLYDAKSESETARKFVDSVAGILHRYQLPTDLGAGKTNQDSNPISNQNVNMSSASMTGTDEISAQPSMNPQSWNFAVNDGIDHFHASNLMFDVDPNLPSYFADWTQAMQGGFAVGGFDWAGVFTELEGIFV